jgi:hypothetical protein
MKLIALLPVVLVALSPQATAQTDAGNEWTVRHGSRKTVRQARLLDVDGDSLRVLVNGNGVALHIDSIHWMETGTGESRSGLYIPLGIVSGGLAGFLFANATKSEESSEEKLENNVPPAMIGALVGGAAGGVIGGIIASGESTRQISFAGQSPGERMRILDSLVAQQGHGRVEASPAKVADTDTLKPVAHSVQGMDSSPRWRFALGAGLAQPVGDFGANSGENGGYAVTGYSLFGKASLRLAPSLRWLTSVTLTSHAIDEEAILLPQGATVDAGSWVLIWPMTGIQVESQGGSSIVVSGSLQIGVLIGTSPDVNITINNQVARQPSASGASVAFSVAIGLVIHEWLLLEASYLSGSPEYEITATGGGASASGVAEQATGVIMLGLGVTL